MNQISKENCNKSHCKSCLLHPDNSKRIKLTKNRIVEIEKYISNFKSHICHNTNKTCYGGLQIQANILFNLGIILDNKVETMINEAEKILNL